MFMLMSSDDTSLACTWYCLIIVSHRVICLVAFRGHTELLPQRVCRTPTQVIFGSVQGVREVIVQVTSCTELQQLFGSSGYDHVTQAVFTVSVWNTIWLQLCLRQHVLHFQILVAPRHPQVQVRVVDLASA